MFTSKAKKRQYTAKQPDQQPTGVPTLEELIAARDYTGAATLLSFKRRGGSNRGDVTSAEWLAYALFHNSEHDKALAVYQELLQAQEDPDPLYHTYSAACYYSMGMHEEAEAAAMQGPRCSLATRILFQCAHARGDEDALMVQHSALSDSLEDQLSLAALHFNRGHFQPAADIYKALLLEHRELAALNVFVAQCYSKLDYFDVANELLAAYLAVQPHSPLATNLKACNTFRLQDGRAAEAEMCGLAELTKGKHTEHDLIRHNRVVFRGGENALQVLPALGNVPPEARLNLAIHHLRSGGAEAAEALLQDVSPSTPHEYILKAIIALLKGQASNSPELLKTAQQHFQVVGSSPTECDTIPGRQAMATCFFLLGQHEDVLVFLNSIKSYFVGDDDFLWNYGLALAATGQYREAEDALGAVQQHRHEPVCLQWRARCLIFSGRAGAAWELFSAAQEAGRPAAAGEGGYALLSQIANDCYRVGAFYYAAKAFDVLERLGATPQLYRAKRGALVGAFQAIVAGREEPELLGEVLDMLARSAAAAAASEPAGSTTELQVQQITQVIRYWGRVHGLL